MAQKGSWVVFKKDRTFHCIVFHDKRSKRDITDDFGEIGLISIHKNKSDAMYAGLMHSKQQVARSLEKHDHYIQMYCKDLV